MDQKQRKFQRCGVLKLEKISEKSESYYNDFQEDYRKFFNLIFSWLEKGYRYFDEDEKIHYVKPKKSALAKTQNYDKETCRLIDDFMSVLIKGGTDASSCYSLFYEKYNPKDSKKYTEFVKLSLENLHNQELQDETIEKLDPDSSISKDEWINVHIPNLKDPENRKSYWENTLGKLLVNQGRSLGKNIRERLQISCKHPSDATYCNRLIKAIGEQIRSFYEKANLHEQQRDELFAQIKSFENDDLYQKVCEFGIVLEYEGSGLSKYVLNHGVKQVLKPVNDSTIKFQVDILSQDRFRSIVEANEKDLLAAYKKYKLRSKLANKLMTCKYVAKSSLKNDFKLPIGQTSLGSFGFSQENGKLVVSSDIGDFNCIPSHYFSQLDCKAIKNSKKQIVGYEISFCHKQKRKPSTKSNLPDFGNKITGVVKELGLQRKNGGFFLSFPYAIHHDYTNFKLATYFNSASPNVNELENLPDEFVAAGIDLNISYPLPIAVAKIGKSINGALIAKDYGRGNVVSLNHLIEDTSLCTKIRNLKSLCQKTNFAIRELKTCNKTNTRISDKTFQQLCKTRLNIKLIRSPESVEDFNKVARLYIQTQIKKIKKLLRKIKYKCRATGYNNISEMIQLLDCMDKYNSLISSFDRIHLKPNQILPAKSRNDNSRANFRLLILRKLAAILVRECQKHHVNVVFAEDLQNNQDSDKSSFDNTLSRLFSPRLMLDTIQLALEKVGIGFVSNVDLRGTSKTDSMTGKIGYRDKFSKRDLYVLRDGKYVRIDSDLNAALNVLIRGLNHSICPYKFFVAKEDDKKREKIGKRLTQFLKDLFNQNSVHFYKQEDGSVIGSGKKLKNLKILENCYLYYREGKFLTFEQHRNEETFLSNKIKDLLVEDGNLPKTDVIQNGIKTYLNFQHLEMHESP